MRGLARGDLGGVEGLAVLRDQRAHHRMLGLVRLQQAAADAFAATGAAEHLMQQLEGALGGARVAVVEAEISIDHTDQVEHREVMALGDELRADDDVEAAGGDVLQFGAQPIHRSDKIVESTSTRACGNNSPTSSSRRSTPGPTATNEFTAWHFGHSAGRGMAKPQWWQTSCRRKR